MWTTLCYIIRGRWTYHKEGKLFGLYCSLENAVHFDALVCISKVEIALCIGLHHSHTVLCVWAAIHLSWLSAFVYLFLWNVDTFSDSVDTSSVFTDLPFLAGDSVFGSRSDKDYPLDWHLSLFSQLDPQSLQGKDWQRTVIGMNGVSVAHLAQ